jgi:hypothetical protein
MTFRDFGFWILRIPNSGTSNTIRFIDLSHSYRMPRGTNSQGNSYNTPGGTNSSSGSSYHYSNSNGSYYYRNDNGSTYYNPGSSGAGSVTYTPSSSSGSGASSGSSRGR